jgi:predicted nucleic acid-binding protein
VSTPRPSGRKRALLDSGAVSAVATGDERAIAKLERLADDRVEVSTPAVVLAECLRGDARDAAANKVIARLVVNPCDEPIARTAASLRGALRSDHDHTDIDAQVTIDAIVVADAVDADVPCLILTSDAGDIGRLAERHPRVRVDQI